MIWYETYNTDIGHHSDHPDPHQVYIDAKQYISDYYNEVDIQYTRESNQFAEDEVSLLEQSFQVREHVYTVYATRNIYWIVLYSVYFS